MSTSPAPPAGAAALLARLAHTPPPFYRQRTAAGEAPRELSCLPLTQRADILADQLAHPPWGTRRFADSGHPIRAGVSGTGVDLLLLGWTANDLARERAAGARMLAQAGVSAGMRIANALPGALATPGALLLGDVVEEIGGLDIPLGAIDGDAAARQAWALIDRVEPAVLILDPLTAPRLFADGNAPAAARRWWRGVLWLRRGTATSPPPIPTALDFEGWQRTWLAVPEATSFVAVSCSAGNFHLDQGVVAEVVDASGTPALPGRDGTLAVTPLGLDTALLRYATGIQARAVEPCPCGRSGDAIALS